MSSAPWQVAASTDQGSKPPLVLVSNMYPSVRHPAYGLFVQRSADQVAPHFHMHYLTMPKTLSRPLRLWRYLKLNVLLAKSLLLHQRALHVVHFPLFFAPALWLVPLTRTVLVLNFHGTDNLLDTPVKRWFGRVLQRATRRAHVVAPSADFARELTERYALRQAQMFVSPSAGVDRECFHPLMAADPAASVETSTGNAEPRAAIATAGGETSSSVRSRQACHVGFVSTLLEEKGWRDYLQVVQKLVDVKAPGTLRFSMVGSGPDDERVASEIRRRRLPIERYPTMTHHQLAAYYQSLSVLVYPSRRESLGLTAIECLACGTPVIAQAIPGPGSYIVSGENGTLVTPGDTDAMREAVLAISALNATERTALGQQCAASVARFDSTVVADELVGFLRRARRGQSRSRKPESSVSS